MSYQQSGRSSRKSVRRNQGRRHQRSEMLYAIRIRIDLCYQLLSFNLNCGRLVASRYLLYFSQQSSYRSTNMYAVNGCEISDKSYWLVYRRAATLIRTDRFPHGRIWMGKEDMIVKLSSSKGCESKSVYLQISERPAQVRMLVVLLWKKNRNLERIISSSNNDNVFARTIGLGN
jgi:hypothetical protein